MSKDVKWRVMFQYQLCQCMDTGWLLLLFSEYYENIFLMEQVSLSLSRVMVRVGIIQVNFITQWFSLLWTRFSSQLLHLCINILVFFKPEKTSLLLLSYKKSCNVLKLEEPLACGFFLGIGSKLFFHQSLVWRFLFFVVFLSIIRKKIQGICLTVLYFQKAQESWMLPKQTLNVKQQTSSNAMVCIGSFQGFLCLVHTWSKLSSVSKLGKIQNLLDHSHRSISGK